MSPLESILGQSQPPRNRLLGWVTYASPTPALGVMGAGTYFIRASVHVTVAFNAGTTNTLTVGFTGSQSAYVTSVDVTTTGVKSVTLGTSNGYQSTAHSVVVYYNQTGTAATTGKAIVILELLPVPSQP